MRKLMKILSFCLIIGSFLTTISFAESNVVESLKEVETDSKTEEIDYNISSRKKLYPPKEQNRLLCSIYLCKDLKVSNETANALGICIK